MAEQAGALGSLLHRVSDLEDELRQLRLRVFGEDVGGGAAMAPDYRFRAYGPVEDLDGNFHVIHNNTPLGLLPGSGLPFELDPYGVYDADTYGLYTPPAGDYYLFFTLFVNFNPAAGGSTWVEVGIEQNTTLGPAFDTDLTPTEKIRIPNDTNDYRVDWEGIVSFDGVGGLRPFASPWANNAGLSSQRNQCVFGGWRLTGG